MNMKHTAVCLGSCMLTFAAFAANVYVDDDNFGKPGLTGATESLAFGTIQDAVEAASSGDTILVLPGVYDKGGKVFNNYSNRVCVTRGGVKLTIRSTGGKNVTRIVGAKDPNGDSAGVGPKAVRPILVYSEALDAPVIFEGFTITGGACHVLADNLNNYGGAVYSLRKNTFLVDCDITGNGGSRGLVFRATCVRCFMHDNFLPSGKGTMAWQSDLLHCVATRNTYGSSVCKGLAVNCTIEDVDGKVGSEGAAFLNSVLMGINGNVGAFEGLVYTNCIADLSANQTSGLTFGDDSFHNKGDAVRFQCIAPLLDDYRLLDTSDAIGFADAALIACVNLPAEIDPYVDFYGNAVARTGSIAAGACQQTVAPAGGAMLFTRPVRILDGASKSFANNGYAFAVEYPVQWHVQPELAEGRYLYNYTIAGATGGGKRVPDMDEKFWVMPPPAGTIATNTLALTSFAYWVNPQTGRDEPEADEKRGTRENPFRTLQKAVTAAETQVGGKTVGAVVFAAEGTYAEGGAWEAYCSNRVSFAKHVRLKGAGAGRSIIKGKLDLTSDDHGDDGRGKAAMRCAYVSGGAIQGFTLDEGRCVWNNGSTATYTGTFAGGVYGQYNPVIADCVITNCSAVRGGPVYATSVFRTRIVDCHVDGAKDAILHCCVFDSPVDCKQIGSGSYTYHCTGVGNATYSAWGADWITSVNSIAFGGPAMTKNHAYYWSGCCIFGFQSYTQYLPSSDNAISDPEFVDGEKGDYRVLSSSAAQRCGEMPADYWTFYSSDFNGKPMFFANGKPMAGALQNPVSAVVVVAPGAAGQITCAGTNVVDQGESLEIEVADGTRHAVDISANGVAMGATQWTYEPPPEGQAGTVRIEAVFSTNWYVNADVNVGDDTNDGFTPETPFRTLAKALSHAALLAGDCVHAAPGVYAEGDMEQKYYGNNDQRTTRVRACIDEGITLVGDGGAEQTVIMGNLEPTSGSVRFGANPLRCVNLTHGAKIIGFTLTGGSAAYATSSGQKEPYLGGGVIAPVPSYSSKRPLVQDCIISNNWACRGGAAFGASLVNCRIVDNYASEDGTATFLSEMVNCLVDRNRGKSASGCAVVRYPYGIRGCTLTDRNIGEDTGGPSTYFIYNYNQYKRGVLNSVIMGGVQAGDRIPATNCVFLAGLSNYGDESDWDSMTTRKLSAAEMMLSADGRPFADSPVIDCGANDYVLDIGGRKDADGGQRIYNGTVDIGCFEYDWRGDYARAIGGGVSVTKASPGVVLRDGAVRLVDGEMLSGEWPATPRRGTYDVPANVSGAGKLTGLFVNEDSGCSQTVEFVAGSPDFTFKLSNTDLAFGFSYSGDGVALLSGFSCSVPGLMLLIH
ncbi:MAG: hypothetical protein IJH50_13560 [Kiritimatiellae bacterium]|nr:hypothetical protein [Kiritimatiellia bacterium]